MGKNSGDNKSSITREKMGQNIQEFCVNILELRSKWGKNETFPNIRGKHQHLGGLVNTEELEGKVGTFKGICDGMQLAFAAPYRRPHDPTTSRPRKQQRWVLWASLGPTQASQKQPLRAREAQRKGAAGTAAQSLAGRKE